MLSDIIYKTLEEVNNVYEGWYRKDLNDTHTTFLINNVVPDSFSDDDYEEVRYLIQVDTWGTDKDEVEKQYNKVKKLLKAYGFEWSESNLDYESDTCLYHYADRFYINLDEGD